MSLTERELLHAPAEALLVAIRDLLEAKGLVSAAEIAERIAITDAASPRIGAAIVARACTDPDYRARLLANGSAAAEEMGAPMRGAPPLAHSPSKSGLPGSASPRVCRANGKRPHLPNSSRARSLIWRLNRPGG